MKKIALIILVSCCMYYLQSYWSGFSSLSLICVLIPAFYYFCKAIVSFSNDKVLVYYLLFVTVNIIWAICSLIWQESAENAHLIMLKNILFSLSPFFPFYYLGLRGYQITKLWRLSLIGLMIVIFINFKILGQNSKFNDVEYVVNNYGYYWVSLIPWLALCKFKRIFEVLIIGIIAFYVISSIKRGAFLCLILGLTVYYFYILQKKRRKINLMAVIILIPTAWLSMELLSNIQGIDYLLNRFRDIEDKTSGRDIIFASLYKYYDQSMGLTEILLGNGFGATNRIIGKYAHNDILEILFNYGIVGFIPYLSFLIFAFKRAIKTIDIDIKYILLMVLAIWMPCAMTSGIFTGTGGFLLTIPLGYMAGFSYNEKILSSTCKCNF